MALNGTAWAGYASALRAYLAGDDPDTLAAVAPGDDDLQFVHDAEREEAETTEAGLLRTGVLVAYVADRTSVGTIYTHGGHTWQVAKIDFDRCAGADWPHRVELVRHAA